MISRGRYAVSLRMSKIREGEWVQCHFQMQSLGNPEVKKSMRSFYAVFLLEGTFLETLLFPHRIFTKVSWFFPDFTNLQDHMTIHHS